MARCLVCNGSHLTTECPEIREEVVREKAVVERGGRLRREGQVARNRRYREKHREKYNAYMREYMRRRRAKSVG